MTEKRFTCEVLDTGSKALMIIEKRLKNGFL